MSESEMMTIMVCYHFGTFANFKHYYTFFIREHLRADFPTAVSYNRFVELMPRVFFLMMLFMKVVAFGRCSGVSFVDSTMIPVCHNLRRYANKVFRGVATDGRGTMGWCHGFKLHLLCNDRGEVMTFCLTDANVDGIHLVHGLKANMKNRLMPMWDRIMLRKRYIIECINQLLKDKANVVHSRHRALHNCIMNICGALTAYCFYDNKPEALPVHLEKSRQLELF